MRNLFFIFHVSKILGTSDEEMLQIFVSSFIRALQQIDIKHPCMSHIKIHCPCPEEFMNIALKTHLIKFI